MPLGNRRALSAELQERITSHFFARRLDGLLGWNVRVEDTLGAGRVEYFGVIFVGGPAETDASSRRCRKEGPRARGGVALRGDGDVLMS